MTPYKYCLVRNCHTTTHKYPGKHFFTVPRGTARKKWCRAMRRMDIMTMSNRSPLYCCEDHFDIEADVANLEHYNLMGGSMKLKPTVTPHRFDCQNLPAETITNPPQLTIKTPTNVSNRSKIKEAHSNYNTIGEDQMQILSDDKKIECLEAVVAYTSQMEGIVRENGDLDSVMQANSHLVTLLDKVVYEWFQRAQKRIEIGEVTDELIIQKAEETKQIFCIQSFASDPEWLNKFKIKYEISDLDMRLLIIDKNISPPSVDINDIVLDVLKNNPLTEYFSITSGTIVEMKTQNEITSNTDTEIENNVKIEETEIDKSHEDNKIKGLIYISNDQEARLLLKPLEEYALLKDNYRAIGLISQLIDIFSEEIKKEE